MSPIAAAVRLVRKNRDLIVEIIRDGQVIEERRFRETSPEELGTLLLQTYGKGWAPAQKEA